MKNELLNEIQGLLEQKASGRYGLSLINQQQHALQGGWLAEQEGMGDAMIDLPPESSLILT